jgi:tetratricopeptide (TPR) repeat protein
MPGGARARPRPTRGSRGPGAGALRRAALGRGGASLPRALALAPGDARTRSNLGGLYLAQRRWDEAIAELDSARAADPRLAEAHFNLGSALFERGRLEEAVSALRAGLALQPGAADERLALARALLAAGDREAAAREAGEVLRSGVADSALRRGAERALEQARRP